MLRTVLDAEVFVVFFAIVYSSDVILSDGESLPYSLLPICPTDSEVRQCQIILAILRFCSNADEFVAEIIYMRYLQGTGSGPHV